MDKPKILIKYKDVIDICCYDFDLKFGKPKNKKNLGEVDWDTLEIIIDPTQPENELGATLIHEILHAHYDKKIGDGTDEVFIEKETQYYVSQRPDIVKLALSFIS
ncbi:hypothetical protein HOG16_02700 [Candidatus Woesearchaeota archaeon]|jgi:hypothetical protein|nr:hypothetical protein [Candidatus Woesearchaeota archaeon]MBT4322007.1 hypothetical protein [Candidatus Woesearchaeota archaeon]MBT4630753.1 hypothetical protein [Candidatus Woesearchaeota archaeon]